MLIPETVTYPPDILVISTRAAGCLLIQTLGMMVTWKSLTSENGMILFEIGIQNKKERWRVHVIVFFSQLKKDRFNGDSRPIEHINAPIEGIINRPKAGIQNWLFICFLFYYFILLYIFWGIYHIELTLEGRKKNPKENGKSNPESYDQKSHSNEK